MNHSLAKRRHSRQRIRGLSALFGLFTLILVVGLVLGLVVFFRSPGSGDLSRSASDDSSRISDQASSTSQQVARSGADDGAEDVGAIYLTDVRITDLMSGCSQEYYYDRDTAFMVPVLVDKLVTGYTEPLQRAKNELAQLGPEAMEAVRRLAEKWYTDQNGLPYVQNALDVAVMSDEPLAREIVLRLLEHPRDSLRRIALGGMAARHAILEDFEPLWFQLEAESVSIQQLILPAMYKADPARAEALFLDWIESGTHAPLWSGLANLLSGSVRPETAARCAELLGAVPKTMKPLFAACAARAGDVESLEFLRTAISEGPELERERAVFACGRAELVELLLSALINDGSASVRLTAITSLAALDATPKIDATLSESLGDSEEGVRRIALAALIRRGDQAATDQALALLEGDSKSRNDALSALRERMLVDAELADRARGRLIMVDHTRKHLPLEERFGVLKTIGAIPGAESAKLLRKIALEHPGKLAKHRAHQMLMVNASNTGEAGRAWLYSELENETDPLKRIDLLWSSTCFRTDGSRAHLRDFLSDPDRNPYEILFASEQLARLGPAQEVASLLKRICYRIQQQDVRDGMRCLLWKWY